MHKKASPQNIAQELRRILAYTEVENPSRRVLARELLRLASRLAFVQEDGQTMAVLKKKYREGFKIAPKVLEQAKQRAAVDENQVSEAYSQAIHSWKFACQDLNDTVRGLIQSAFQGKVHKDPDYYLEDLAEEIASVAHAMGLCHGLCQEDPELAQENGLDLI